MREFYTFRPIALLNLLQNVVALAMLKGHV